MTTPTAEEKAQKKYKNRKVNLKSAFTINELPWTLKQKTLISLLQKASTKCCFISGSAGTSKTICAMYSGLSLLKEGKISDITYVRSAVESSGSKLGFLPGDVNEKFGVYTTPLQEKLDELLAPQTAKALTDAKRVVAMPINFMRGLHASGRLLILDESQNFYYDELVTAITRIGEYSRIWIVGDPKQSDLGKNHAGKSHSGFIDFKEKLKGDDCSENGIHHFEFTKEDIVRSEFCKFVVGKLELD